MIAGTGSSDDMSQRQILKPNPIQKTSFLSSKRRRLGHILIISRVGYVIPDFWNQYINRLNFSKARPCKGFFARPGKLAAGSSDDMSQRQILKPNPIQKTSFLPLKRRRLGHILIISRVGYVIPDFWNQYINRLNFSKA